MKTGLLQKQISPPGRRAFTLVEMMIATSVFTMVSIGVVYTHMFGLMQNELVQSKLGSSDQSRRGFDLLTRDIRSTKKWDIGNGGASSFTLIANGTQQKGNAIRLSLTTDTNQYIVYYFDTSARELRRRHSGVSGTTLLASYLTNNMFFQAEDHRGAIKTTRTYKAIINTKMEFAQYQYPLTKVGQGYRYDYYKLEFRVTPHAPDGP